MKATRMFDVLIAVFTMLALVGQTAKANDLTVYDGTDTNQKVPAYIYYFDDFTRSQFVIPANDLMAVNGGTITSLTFYTSSNYIPYTTVSSANVYLMEVGYTSISAFEDMATNATQVYTGYFEIVSADGGGQLTITFDTPYSYGGGNLLIGIENTDDSQFKSITFYGQTVNGASVSGFNSGSLDAVTPTQQNFIPKTTFTYTGGTVVLPTPTGLVASLTPGNGTVATLSWTERGTATQWTLQYGTDAEFDTYTEELSISGTPSASLTDLTPEQLYYARVKAIDGEDYESGWSSTLTFRPSSKNTIGSGTVTNGYLPTNTYDNYSLTQQIYTPTEIGSTGMITSIDFYSTVTARTRDLDIYMLHTDKETFADATDWETVTSGDLVFSGEVTFAQNEWTPITLDTPFAYDGANNLVLVVDDNTQTWHNGPSFRVFDATGQAIIVYSDNTNYDPTAPSYSGTVLNVKNQIRLGITTSGTIVIPPSSLTTTDVEAHSATLSWSGGTGLYNVEYKKQTDDDWTSYLSYTADTTCELTELSSATDYQARVQSIDDGDNTSVWRTVSFATAIVCLAPTDLVCTFTPGNGTVAQLDWTENGTATEWTLQYGTDAGFDSYTEELNVSTTPSVSLTGLTSEETYYARVKAIDGDGEESRWSTTLTFQPTVKTVIGSGTDTNSYLPSYTYDKYSLTQQIYTPAEIGSAGTITSIDFYSTATLRTRNLDIYMLHTTKETFAGIQDWETVSSSDLVFSGDVTFAQNAWTAITLDTPFAYDGTNKLVLVVDDNTGSYINYPSFRVFDATDQAIRIYSDNINFDPTDSSYSGSVMDVKNQIRLGITTDGPVVIAPSSLTATDVTPHGATLTWSGGMGLYNVEYKKQVDENWTSRLANTTNTTCTLTGLDAETAYQARVQSVDNGNNTSVWRTVSFTTTIACPAPTDLVCTLTPGNGTIAQLNWTENGVATQWQICLNGDEANLITANTNPHNLTNLTPETAYTAKVRAVGDGYSQWSAAITFTPTDAYTLTINEDSTSTNSYVPVYGTWVDNYSRSQFIVKAEDLSMMSGGTIGKLTFYANTPSITWGAAKFDVYLGEVTETGFSSATFVDWTSLTNVYSDSLGVSDRKMEITLTNPYIYQGGNLLVGISQNTPGAYKTSYWYGASVTGAAVGGYENMNGSQSFGVKDFQPKTTFSYSPNASGVTPPETLTATDVTAHGVILSWSGGTGLYNVEYKQNGDENWTSHLANTTNTTCELVGLEPETVHQARVQSIDGSNNTSPWRTITFTTPVACPAPTELAYSNLTAVSVTLDWTENGDATEWQICLNGDEEHLITANTNPYTVTGLTPETAYTAKVRAVGDGVSQWTSTVSFTTPELYLKPTDLACTLDKATPTQAILSWTENGTATQWQICLNDDEANLITANANPYTLTGLIAEHEYTAKVRAVAGEGQYSGWSTAIKFEPTAKTVIGSGNGENNVFPATLSSKYSLTQQIYTAEELNASAGQAILSADFYCTGNPTRNFDIYIVHTDSTKFGANTEWIAVSAADLVYSGEVDFVANAWTTIEFDTPFIYNGSSNIAFIVNDKTGTSTSYRFKVFETNLYQSLYHYNSTSYDPTNPPSGNGAATKNKNIVRFLFGTPPTCLKPTGLTVSCLDRTATVTWTSDAEAWQISIDDGEPINVNTTSYTINNLEYATTHTVKVRTSCGGGDYSDWTKPVTFHTPICAPEDMCQITFELTDSYGDSWNGAAIQVVDVLTGIVIATVANENLNGTWESGENEVNTIVIDVPANREIQFQWISGKYDSECSYVAYDVNGIEIFSGSRAMSAPVNYIVDCVSGGDVNDDGHYGVGDVTAIVDIIRAGGYDEAADMDGDSDVDADDLEILLNTKILHK